MLSLDLMIVLFALAFFFWRASEDGLRAQRSAAQDPESYGAQQRNEPLPVP
jgi:hypothetical protein